LFLPRRIKKSGRRRITNGEPRWEHRLIREKSRTQKEGKVR